MYCAMKKNALNKKYGLLNGLPNMTPIRKKVTIANQNLSYIIM